MLKISYAGCLGLSPAISAQFTLEMRVGARNREKFIKTLILVVQGHQCWHSYEARCQCLLWYAAYLCLSATIFTL